MYVSEFWSSPPLHPSTLLQQTTAVILWYQLTHTGGGPGNCPLNKRSWSNECRQPEGMSTLYRGKLAHSPRFSRKEIFNKL